MNKRFIAIAAVVLAVIGVAVVIVFKSGWVLPQSTSADTPPAQVATREDILKVRPDDIVLGVETAPILMIEYASLTCGHCAAFEVQTMPQIKQNYIDTGLVRFVYRDFPLDQIAAAASVVGRACLAPEKYFPYAEMMFRNQADWAHADDPREGIITMARRAALSREQVESCLKDDAVYQRVKAVAEEAATVLGINSTPTFYINGKEQKGALPYAEFEEVFKGILQPSPTQ